MDAHEELLDRWARRPHHQGHCFIKDGIIDYRRWHSKAPRVLFLLKEARHDGPESIWDLRAFIREAGPYGLTFKNSAYWCYAIHHIASGSLPRFPVQQSAIDEAAELFLCSAVVNIKKSRGMPRSTSRRSCTVWGDRRALHQKPDRYHRPQHYCLWVHLAMYQTLVARSKGRGLRRGAPCWS
jgi:hypothetical protein